MVKSPKRVRFALHTNQVFPLSEKKGRSPCSYQKKKEEKKKFVDCTNNGTTKRREDGIATFSYSINPRMPDYEKA